MKYKTMKNGKGFNILNSFPEDNVGLKFSDGQNQGHQEMPTASYYVNRDIDSGVAVLVREGCTIDEEFWIPTCKRLSSIAEVLQTAREQQEKTVNRIAEKRELQKLAMQ